jgi:hypothetical protein
MGEISKLEGQRRSLRDGNTRAASELRSEQQKLLRLEQNAVKKREALGKVQRGIIELQEKVVHEGGGSTSFFYF